MNMRKIIGLVLIAVTSALLFGCASVSITDAWVNPGYSGNSVDRILVVGLAHRPQVRTSFEYQLQHNFTKRGVTAIASVDRLPRGVQLDRQTFKQYMGKDQIRAILVTSLVSAETIEEYIPGNTYVAPAGYYRTWDGFYATRYNVYQEPGYVTSSTEYVMESNLYDIASEKLIWRGVSMAVDPENAIEVVEELSGLLVDQLGKDGLVVLNDKE